MDCDVTNMNSASHLDGVLLSASCPGCRLNIKIFFTHSMCWTLDTTVCIIIIINNYNSADSSLSFFCLFIILFLLFDNGVSHYLSVKESGSNHGVVLPQHVSNMPGGTQGY